MEQDRGFFHGQEAAGTRPSIPFKAPTFASLTPESGFLRAGSNLAACISGLRKAPETSGDASLFRSARLEKNHPARSLVASFLLHVGVIACLVNLPSFPAALPGRARREPPKSDYKVLWYSKADLLPAVSPPPESSKAKPARKPRKKAAPPPEQKLAFNPVQVIISRPPKPDNAKQTIVQPEAPNLRIPSHLQVPNVVSWAKEVLPPSPAALEAKRQLAQMSVPGLPAPVVAAPPPPEPPKPPELNRKLSELQIAAPAAADPSRDVKLPVSEAAPLTAPPAPKAITVPAPPALVPEVNQGGLRNLIAVGIAPAPPEQRFEVPAGNRAGEFAASPQGSGNEKSSAEDNKKTAGQGSASPDLASKELAEIRVPHLSISGGKNAEPRGPVAAKPPEPPPPTPRQTAPSESLSSLMAKATRPSLLPLPETSRSQTPIEASFFGVRRVRTVLINMPNLTSGSGSWVLHFAELNGEPPGKDQSEEISSPVAVRKVDPRYSPSAVRDRVEGTVMLAAHILRDGTVSNIRVLRGLDPRLDSSAMEALTDWKFVPAKKRGTPVDLEILVQIPFRLPTF